MSSQPEGKGGFVRAIGLFPATALNMSRWSGSVRSLRFR